MNRNSALLRCEPQRVCSFARLFGRTKYPCDGVAPQRECLENRFTKVPLSHDGNAHGSPVGVAFAEGYWLLPLSSLVFCAQYQHDRCMIADYRHRLTAISWLIPLPAR